MDGTKLASFARCSEVATLVHKEKSEDCWVQLQLKRVLRRAALVLLRLVMVMEVVVAREVLEAPTSGEAFSWTIVLLK